MRYNTVNDICYGSVINSYYDWINMLNSLKDKNPNRFEEFSYSDETIYHYLEKVEQEQHTLD